MGWSIVTGSAERAGCSERYSPRISPALSAANPCLTVDIAAGDFVCESPRTMADAARCPICSRTQVLNAPLAEEPSFPRPYILYRGLWRRSHPAQCTPRAGSHIYVAIP